MLNGAYLTGRKSFMRYYGFELGTNVDEIRNNTKIELRHYGYDNVLAAVNNYMYQNIKNDVNFFVYREEEQRFSAVFSHNEKKVSFQNACNTICEMLKDIFSIKKIKVMPFEITMQQFLDCVLEARRREYFNFSNRIIEESNLWMDCTCYEKKQLWNGFLHHIHYQPKNEEAEIFVHAMRTKGNESVYSEFEKLMQKNRYQQAAELLREKKGTSALLRNMDYIISRMDREDEQTFLSEFPEDCSTLILLQLLFRYEGVQRKDGRIFKFTQHNLMKVHYETPEESKKCQSRLTEEQVKEVEKMIRSKLSEKLRNRLGKVYIEPSMKNYTLPLAENTSQGGLGVLSKGSRIPIDEGKKLRAFTYWEKVNDIDLSVCALTEDGNRREFSWRTMSRHQSGAITYSGDETSGYLGGSEYFDINLTEFKARYSEYRYLIFCDNVYSGKNFNKYAMVCHGLRQNSRTKR